MATHELIPSYEGLPSHIAYTDLVQHSDRYAGDGWLLIGDAAYFVNPLYSPGMTYGHSLASVAARETVSALESGDLSEGRLRRLRSGRARSLRSARDRVRVLLPLLSAPRRVRAGLHVPARLLHQARARAHPAVRRRRSDEADIPASPRRATRGAGHGLRLPGPAATGRRRRAAARGRRGGRRRDRGAFEDVLGPVFEEIGATEEVLALRLGVAFQNYDDRLQRVPRKEDFDSLVPSWRCPRCRNFTPVEFATCYACGEPAPEGAHRPPDPSAGPPGPPGGGPPGPVGAPPARSG